jgi:chromosome segregation ATPase
LNEIDQLEQELSELRRRFSQSVGVLEELSQVRSQFADLNQTHQALKDNLARAQSFLDKLPAQSGGLDQKFSHLESQVEQRHEQLQAQLTNFRFDFDSMTRQMREEIDRVNRETNPLDSSGDKNRISLDENDRLKWLESSLQHLNASIYAEQANLQALDRRLNQLKRTVDIIAMAGFVGIVIIFLAFFIRS